MRLELRTDGRALVPEGAPAVVFDREIREEFGVRDPIAVVLRTGREDGIFRPEILKRVAELTAAFQKLDGVRSLDVTSLATELGFRHRPGTLRFRRLLEPVPETAEQLAELRSDLERIELYDGILVTPDASATAILVAGPARTRPAAADPRDPRSRHCQRHGGDPGAGSTVAESLLGSHILADLGVPPSLLGDPVRPGGMVPIAVVVMGLIFWIAFRRPAAALLPLSEIGVCLVVVFGAMGWLGVPVYLTTAVLPSSSPPLAPPTRSTSSSATSTLAPTRPAATTPTASSCAKRFTRWRRRSSRPR